jgi:hypothetical protein
VDTAAACSPDAATTPDLSGLDIKGCLIEDLDRPGEERAIYLDTRGRLLAVEDRRGLVNVERRSGGVVVATARTRPRARRRREGSRRRSARSASSDDDHEEPPALAGHAAQRRAR